MTTTKRTKQWWIVCEYYTAIIIVMMMKMWYCWKIYFWYWCMFVPAPQRWVLISVVAYHATKWNISQSPANHHRRPNAVIIEYFLSGHHFCCNNHNRIHVVPAWFVGYIHLYLYCTLFTVLVILWLQVVYLVSWCDGQFYARSNSLVIPILFSILRREFQTKQ